MALFPVLVVLALAVVVAGVSTLVRGTARSREVGVAVARRHGLAVSVLAPVIGVVAAVALVVAGGDGQHGFPGSTGDALALVPLAYALAHTLVLALGELTWPTPHGQVRRARLVHRRLPDVAPWLLLRLAVGGSVFVGAVLAVGAALAAPDGRSITRGTARIGAEVRTASPWPGWHYGRPIAVELGLLLLLGAAALWLVVNRPAVVTGDDRVEVALRRISAHRVLRGIAAGVVVLAGGLLSAAGSALGSVQALPGPVGLALGLVGEGVAVAGLVLLCLPAPRMPDTAPAVPVG